MTYFGANLRGASEPIVIVALHLPDLSVARGASLAFLEDYVLANMEVFAATGVSSVMLQDQTREVGPASASTIAIMGASGRLARRKFPRIDLGIIVQAHDAEAPLAIAHAVGATFWLKVFVRSVVDGGPKEWPCSRGTQVSSRVTTRRHRDPRRYLRSHQRANHIGGAERSSQGGRKLSADGLVITGGSFADSLGRIRRGKAAGLRRPILIGGSVSEDTVREALEVADGAIVSSALMREQPGGDLPHWDAEKPVASWTRCGMAGRARERRHDANRTSGHPARAPLTRLTQSHGAQPDRYHITSQSRRATILWKQ